MRGARRRAVVGEGVGAVLGTTFGPYRIEELLGRGGMGEVYRAHDTERDRMVALKVLPTHLAEDEEYQERFRRECRAAARLNEPHIVPIHTFGEIDGRLFLDMRLVEGVDLASWLRIHGAMEPAAAVSVVSQIASALDAAHAAGLVHRDVKPSNVLLAGVHDGRVDRDVFAYLFDFGIARAQDGMGDDPALTRAGTMPGSLAYIAPERFSGVEGDLRADVYALACVLHQALTGRPPFEGDLATLMRAHLNAPPPRPSSERPELPPGLDRVVAQGMAKDPAQRPASAGALAAAARAEIGATSQASNPRTAVIPPGWGSAPGQPTPSGSWGGPPSGQGPTSSGFPGAAPAYGPPSGYSQPGHPRPGYPQPGQPTYAQQPTYGRQPAYAASGPPPGWASHPSHPAGPGGPPPQRRRTGLVVAGVVAALVLVGGGITAAVLLSGSGGGGGGTTTTLAAPPTTTTTTTTTTPPPTTTTTPTGSDPVLVSELLAGLPAGYDASNCVEDPIEGSPAAASVACGGPPSTGTGPEFASFSRYATRADMAQDFATLVDEADVTVSPEIADCGAGSNVRITYSRTNGTEGGELGCYVLDDGKGVLVWTDERVDSLGYVFNETGDVASLYTWWQGVDFAR